MPTDATNKVSFFVDGDLEDPVGLCEIPCDRPAVEDVPVVPKPRDEEALKLSGTEEEKTRVEIKVATVSETLGGLDCYSRGRWTALRAERAFLSHVYAANRCGIMAVLATLPLIIWSVGATLNDMDTGQVWISLWGAMLLTYVFSVGPTLGLSIRWSVDALIGTVLAQVNIVLINHVLGFWLNGGAYQDRELAQIGQTTVTRSRWLPLCTSMGQDLFDRQSQWDGCFVNVQWKMITGYYFAKVIFIVLNTVLFNALVLTIGFNNNTRMFALSNHAWYMMSFVNPANNTFTFEPNLSWAYFVMSILSWVIIPPVYLFPTPIDELSSATLLAKEASEAVGSILAALPLTPSELTREKTAAALAEVHVVLKDIQVSLKQAWWEDLGVGCRALRRRRLQAFVNFLQDSIEHIPAVLHAAAATARADADRVQEKLDSASLICANIGLLVTSCSTSSEWTPDADLMEQVPDKVEQLSAQFKQARASLAPAALVFIVTLSGVIDDVSLAASFLRNWQDHFNKPEPIHCRPWRFVKMLLEHADTHIRERAVTHPRFVLRNTISVTLALLIGWVGIEDVLPPYSATPAITVAVIMYTYTGASTPLTLKRLNGVVLGLVIGSMANRLFAIQLVGCAIAFAVFLWIMIGFGCFLLFHSPKMAYIGLITAAYGSAFMMPANGVFRDPESKVNPCDGSLVFYRVAGLVIAVLIILFVDFLLASSARNQVRQRLLRSLHRSSELISRTMQQPSESEQHLEQRTASNAELLEDLDELTALLPYAAEESGRLIFKEELYTTMRNGLKAIGTHMVNMDWALSLLKRRGEIRTPGSYHFQEGEQSPKVTATPFSCRSTALHDSVYQPILNRMEQELQEMLDNITTLTAECTQEFWLLDIFGGPSSEAEEVKENLRASLYKPKVVHAFRRAPATSPWKAVHRIRPPSQQPAPAPGGRASCHTSMQLLPTEALDDPPQPMRRSCSETDLKPGPRPRLQPSNEPVTSISGSSPGTSNTPTSLRLRLQTAAHLGGKVAKVLHKLRAEELEDTLYVSPQLPPVTHLEPRARCGAADHCALRLLLNFESLRTTAAISVGSTPQEDALSLVEVVIFLLSSVQDEMQKLQIHLLEY